MDFLLVAHCHVGNLWLCMQSPWQAMGVVGYHSITTIFAKSLPCKSSFRCIPALSLWQAMDIDGYHSITTAFIKSLYGKSSPQLQWDSSFVSSLSCSSKLNVNTKQHVSLPWITTITLLMRKIRQLQFPAWHF